MLSEIYSANVVLYPGKRNEVLTCVAVRDKSVAPPTASSMGKVGSVLKGRGEIIRVRRKRGESDEYMLCALLGRFFITRPVQVQEYFKV